MSFKKTAIATVKIGIFSAFVVMAAASASTSSSDIYEATRAGLVGASAGSEGKILIGRASSYSEARNLAAEKGYTYFTWDSVNGAVYAK